MSKTKVGATLLGLSIVFGSMYGIYTGDLAFMDGLTTIVATIGGVMTVFGVRDWPVINK